MKSFSKNIIFALMIFFLMATLYATLIGSVQEKESITISKLVEEINNGEVKSVVLEMLRPQNLVVEVKGPSALVLWVRLALPLVIPIVFIILLIWFMGRKVQQANIQALGFGQSRARLVKPHGGKHTVTFKDVAGVDEAKE